MVGLIIITTISVILVVAIADRHQFSGSPPLADQIAWVGHCARSNIYQANNASGMCNAYI